MKPIDRILVLTDFSEGATPQVEYAISLAKAAEARLFLLHTGLASVPESAGSYVTGAFANGTSVAYPPAIIQKFLAAGPMRFSEPSVGMVTTTFED